MAKKGHKSKKHKKHKMCAGLRCRNIVAKDSKKGALCSVCREKLGMDVLVPEKAKKPTPGVDAATPEKVKEELEQLSVTDRLAALRRRMNAG